MIQRLLYDRIKHALAHNPSVALLGMRQVGKTTLSQTIRAETNNALYLDLESPEDLQKLNDPIGFFKQHRDKLIILDEIQRVPELFATLRGIIDGNKSGNAPKAGQFLFLGSASMDLMRQTSESLAGRISYLEMGGVHILDKVSGSYDAEMADAEMAKAAQMFMARGISEDDEEFYQYGESLLNKARGKSKTTTNIDTQQLWFRGGFPNAYLADDDNIAMEWLENLIQTYLERDIPQMGFRVPATNLRRLWVMLAHAQGDVVNYSKLAGNLGISSNTVKHYIDMFVSLLLVRELQPYHSNSKKRVVKHPRFYVRDSGIVHRLLGISNHDALLSHPILGKSWEGFVIENIHAVLPKIAETYFYRTNAGAEIDLVIKMPSSEIWAVEIKYGHTPTLGKHYKQTFTDVGATHKYIIYGGDDEFSKGDNVTMLSLSKFIQKLQ